MQKEPDHTVEMTGQPPFSPNGSPSQARRPISSDNDSKPSAIAVDQARASSPRAHEVSPEKSPRASLVWSATAGTPATTPTGNPSDTSPPYNLADSELPDSAGAPTGDELLHDIYHFLLEGAGEDIAQSFMFATSQPPVTRESLAELNTSRIINNPKLRHDVNFDRELHFRPNLDGSKGKQKQKAAEEYWNALRAEFWICALVQSQLQGPGGHQAPEYWMAILEHSHKRLPNVFNTVRDILKTLVPDNDQAAILERLDVPLIMQEIDRGVCDLIDLADWLAKVLKRHCAPMRDASVDRMQASICLGTEESDVFKLVDGLRQLLNILEAMKLDVANHQIRHMRPLLVEDSVNFSRRYNAHRISQNKINVVGGREWFEDETFAIRARQLTPPDQLEVLSSIVLRGVVFSDSCNHFPQMFYMDSDRLRGFRLELRQLIFQEVCCMVFRDVCDPRAIEVGGDQAGKALRKAVSDIVGHSKKFSDRLGNIAVEIMRTVCKLEGRDPPVDTTLLGFIEHKLEYALKTTSSEYEFGANDIVARILPKLVAAVEQHIHLPALALQDRLVPQAVTTHHQFGVGAVCVPSVLIQSDDPDSDLINRMTHMIVLHWQVWGSLVYLTPMPVQQDVRPFDTERSFSPVIPTVPVSQAVYSPGAKFLPIQINTTEVLSGYPTPIPSPAPSSQSSNTNPTSPSDMDDAASWSSDSESL